MLSFQLGHLKDEKVKYNVNSTEVTSKYLTLDLSLDQPQKGVRREIHTCPFCSAEITLLVRSKKRIIFLRLLRLLSLLLLILPIALPLELIIFPGFRMKDHDVVQWLCILIPILACYGIVPTIFENKYKIALDINKTNYKGEGEVTHAILYYK